MLTSPSLVAYAAFLGLHRVAQEHLKRHAEAPDGAERLRVYLAAYSLGGAMLLQHVRYSRGWPHDDFIDRYLRAFVRAPGYPKGTSTLEDVVVHAREKHFISEELKKATYEKDSDELWNRLRDSSNLFQVLLPFRNLQYSAAMHEASLLQDDDDEEAHALAAGVYCTTSWLWGAVPETAETKAASDQLFRGVFDWMERHIIPPLRDEEA
jgi:hypothetical protein